MGSLNLKNVHSMQIMDELTTNKHHGHVMLP